MTKSTSGVIQLVLSCFIKFSTLVLFSACFGYLRCQHQGLLAAPSCAPHRDRRDSPGVEVGDHPDQLLGTWSMARWHPLMLLMHHEGTDAITIHHKTMLRGLSPQAASVYPMLLMHIQTKQGSRLNDES